MKKRLLPRSTPLYCLAQLFQRQTHSKLQCNKDMISAIFPEWKNIYPRWTLFLYSISFSVSSILSFSSIFTSCDISLGRTRSCTNVVHEFTFNSFLCTQTLLHNWRAFITHTETQYVFILLLFVPWIHTVKFYVTLWKTYTLTRIPRKS